MSTETPTSSTESLPPDVQKVLYNKLNKFSDEQFEELLFILFMFLSDPSRGTRLNQQLEEFASNHNADVGVLKSLFKSLLAIPNNAVRQNSSSSQLCEELVNSGLVESKAKVFAKQFESNLVSLSKSALSQTLMVNQLVDMEWKFGVTAATSEVNKMGNTYLQLKLVVNSGNKLENVSMELTLPQFYNFLHEMEKAKATLDSLR